jgi:hypothetical protein
MSGSPFVILPFICWILLTIYLVIITIMGITQILDIENFYIESMPFIDEIGTYQVYNCVPMCLFTKCFDKKIYTEYNVKSE